MFVSSKQLRPLSIVSAVCAKPRVASTCEGELTSGVSMRESGKITSEWKEKLQLSVSTEGPGSLPQSGSDSDTFMRPEPHNDTSYDG